MNAAEGLMRIAQIVRWLGRIFGALFGLVGVIALFTDTSERVGLFFILIVAGIIVFVIGMVLAWVIDGFAKPSAPDSPSGR